MATIELDKSLRIPEYSEVCTFCVHYRPADGETGRSCSAFGTDAIPLAIWTGENKHTAPYPGDQGITFAPVNATEQRP